MLKSYIKYLYNSKNEHGVHSPFVFELITKCFYDKNNYPEYKILEHYRKSLLNNNNSIEVTDFGAGSRVFKTNKRQIAAIAKTAGISVKRAQLLFRIVNYFQPETILEIGTSLGLATTALSLGNKNASIISVEGCANTIEVSKIQSSKFQVANVAFVNSEFSEFLKKLENPSSLDSEMVQQSSNFKLVYIDGNHTKKATLSYFELLLPTITNDTVWIFDDIHWSKEMEAAWETIKKHPKVKVTIDTFQWGIVFFRKEQEKEHFTIRV
jgi:predicted O-methyltransferase YrrM